MKNSPLTYRIIISDIIYMMKRIILHISDEFNVIYLLL